MPTHAPEDSKDCDELLPVREPQPQTPRPLSIIQQITQPPNPTIIFQQESRRVALEEIKSEECYQAKHEKAIAVFKKQQEVAKMQVQLARYQKLKAQFIQANEELRSEIADIVEQTVEKDSAKTKKRRESYERLDQAKRIFSDETRNILTFANCLSNMAGLDYNAKLADFDTKADDNVYKVEFAYKQREVENPLSLMITIRAINNIFMTQL